MRNMNTRPLTHPRIVHGRASHHPTEAPRRLIHLDKQAVIQFVAEVQKGVIDMRAAVEQHDLATVKRVSHYLHGAAAFVDAPAMMQLCRSLEYMGASDDLSRVDDALTALEIESAWVWIELNEDADEQAEGAA